MRVCLQPASGVGKQKRTFFPFCCDEKRLPLQYFCSWHGISVHLKTVCLSECLLWIKKAIHTFQMLLIFAVPQICVRQCDAFVRWIRAIVHPKLSVTCVLITRNFAFGCRDIRFIRALFLCSFTKQPLVAPQVCEITADTRRQTCYWLETFAATVNDFHNGYKF